MMRKLLWIGSLSYLATGFSHVLIGAILTSLLDHYGGAYSEGGRLVFAQFSGFLIGVSAVGFIVQRLGRRTVLVAAMAIMAAAQFYAMTLPGWEILTGVLFIMGIAFGSIESSIGALILLAFKEKQAGAMGKLELYFGLGALLMPFFAGVFLYFDAWPMAFLPLGLLALALALAWRLLDFGTEAEAYMRRAESSPARGQARRKARSAGEGRGAAAGSAAAPPLPRSGYGMLGGFALFFFLYVGMEVCIVEFAPSWMKDGYALSTSASAWSVTAFWFTMSVGRALIGVLAERFSYAAYLTASIVLSLAAATGLALSSTAWVAYMCMAVLGFAMAGIFAVALIYANSMITGREQFTTSFLIAAGGVGGSLLPLLLGGWMDRFGALSSIWLLTAAIGLMLLIVISMPLFKRQGRQAVL
ncbi:MAG: transporter [Paenibacillaceae bacterium]|jgi:FHS family glucose/mannose:H+ symporter-like MFS transporter|nr:transporter [Paenibacillaceae bacterium]